MREHFRGSPEAESQFSQVLCDLELLQFLEFDPRETEKQLSEPGGAEFGFISKLHQD